MRDGNALVVSPSKRLHSCANIAAQGRYTFEHLYESGSLSSTLVELTIPRSITQGLGCNFLWTQSAEAVDLTPGRTMVNSKGLTTCA